MTQQPFTSQQAPRPGQMTAVMRAVAATGPKVLRIGVVQSGRVVEERIIKQRTHVTVGPSEKSMFVISSDAVPANFRLFELVADEYCLNFVDSMTGRVALPSGISDLAVLKGHAKRSAQGIYQLKLTEDSRGKVVLGDVTFLFQFVAPPPVQPRPQLPVAVLRGATSIDWTTTMIAAFSFLIHFLGIGSLYSDWLDPIVNEEASLASLVDSVKSLPPPPPVEQDKSANEDKANKADEKAEAPKQASGQSANAAAGPKGPKMSAAQAAKLSKEMEALEMATLGALSSGAGAATQGVLTGQEVATGALDQVASTSAGVTGGMGDLKLGGGGGAIRPGMAGGSLKDLGSSGKTEGTQGTGAANKVSGPKGNASVGGAAVSGGAVANASRVVAGMRAGFRNCFNRELASNPDASGTIRLTIKVGPGGEVQSVTAAPSGALGSAVECVKARARSANFDPPEGGSAVIVVPVTFVKQ